LLLDGIDAFKTQGKMTLKTCLGSFLSLEKKIRPKIKVILLNEKQFLIFFFTQDEFKTNWWKHNAVLNILGKWVCDSECPLINLIA
jgi:hypothetical protein